MNAGERRLALASALSLKAHADQIRTVKSLPKKTSDASSLVKDLHGSTLFVIDQTEKLDRKSVANLDHSHCDVVTHLNPHTLLKYDFCVFTDKALETLSTHFA